jgi:hypothetical protein
MSNNRILNLDELFGTARPIAVELGGVKYDLSRPEAFTAKQYQQFTKFWADFNPTNFQNSADADEVEKVMDQILDMLNPALAKKLSFAMKVKVLEFYGNEISSTGAGNDQGKKSTGA